MTNQNFGQPIPPPPMYPAPPPKKGLGTGAIIAIVIGAVIIACCGFGAIVSVFGGDDTQPSAVAATDDAPPPAASPAAVVSPAAPKPTEAAAPDGPVAVKVGQALNLKARGSETKVTIKSVKKAKSDNMFDKPERGQYVAVNVDIFATKGQTDLGPSNFRLIAKDGTVYQYEILVAGIDPQLDAMTTVEQGQRKTGLVVFDIDPEKFAGLKVQVSDDYGDVQGYWTS
ncbi:DUF4352 domain-containing protein [Catellatospora methionotrophica]|uniref:DUF4352 domain-containing protein n=1 Tax=Catellatospora methionotrophica TaxID=121620 RepID=UPI0033D9C42A